MVNPQLVNYIQTEYSKGHTFEQIKDFIIKRGYNAADVDAAINEITSKNLSSQKQPIPPMPNMKTAPVKKRSTSISVISILFFIGGGIGLLMSIFALISGSGIAHNNAVNSEFVNSTSMNVVVRSSEFNSTIINTLTVNKIFKTANLIYTIFYLMFSLGVIFVAYGLWKLKEWARITAIVLSALSCLTIIGIPLGVVFIIFLSKNKNKESFGVA